MHLFLQTLCHYGIFLRNKFKCVHYKVLVASLLWCYLLGYLLSNLNDDSLATSGTSTPLLMFSSHVLLQQWVERCLELTRSQGFHMG